MKTILTPIVFAVVFLAVGAQADPQLTSWFTDYSAQYARAYTNTTKRANDSSVTMWIKQSVPAYADVQSRLLRATADPKVHATPVPACPAWSDQR